jgi:hypothetical protein
MIYNKTFLNIFLMSIGQVIFEQIFPYKIGPYIIGKTTSDEFIEFSSYDEYQAGVI